MVFDPLKPALDKIKMPGNAETPDLPAPEAGIAAQPLAAFLNPETGQATAVSPDPAGWPKAEIAPGPAIDDPADDPDLVELLAEGPKPPQEAGLPAPDLPELEMPKPPIQAPGLPPVQLNNPETGQATRIAADDAGWPKAEVGPELPKVPEMELPGTEVPKLPEPLGAAGPVPKLEQPELGLPKKELPGGAEPTEILGLETGDLTTVVPDPAGWPKASVQKGTGPSVPDLSALQEALPTELPDPLKELGDKV